jgi:hypothetical protein
MARDPIDRPNSARPSRSSAGLADLARSVDKGASGRPRSATSRPPINLADLARAAVDKEDTNERLAVAKQTLSHAARSRSTGESMSQTAAPPPPRKRRRAPVFFYSFITLVTIAAVAGFYLHRIQHPLIGKLAAMVGVSLGAAAPAPAPVVSVVQVAASAAPQASAQEKAAEPAPADEGAATEEGPAAAPGAVRRQVARTAKGKGEPAKAEPEAAKKTAEEAKQPAAEPAKGKEAGSLTQEIEKRSQAAKEKKAEAESSPAAPVRDESRPLEPSTGDVSSAMARVKPAAQACLAGQPSTATATASVTFSSDGRVQSVALSGPGAAAAGGCIKSAISAARVSPFSKPSFSISTTIRPVVRAASD